MHIPDGFVNLGTAVVTYAGSIGVLSRAVKHVNRELEERQVPLMGVTAAFIFAAQMINFKVAMGTSGHLLGGALAAILLGPWAGSLVITAVLIVQALLFQDGGIIALGANIFNMAIVGVWTGYGVYTLLKRLLPHGRVEWLAGFAAGWASVVLASLVASLELAISGMGPLAAIAGAMGSVHVLIGVGEGLITSAVVAFLARTRHDLLTLNPVKEQV